MARTLHFVSAQRPRPRDLDVAIGLLPAGPLNAITDVPGVRVGHVTLSGEDPTVRSGVTAIVPGPLADQFHRPMAAGMAVLNGAGELTGSLTIQEWGTLETPIVLCATMSVGMAYQGVVEAMLEAVPQVADDVVIPVIGECDDSWLNDPSACAVTSGHVRQAISQASPTSNIGGAIGAGHGMTCLGWKGGIGTSSRLVDGYTVGVLVLTNFGGLERLCVDGHHVGQRFAAAAAAAAAAARTGGVATDRVGKREASEGSCIVVIATDAPMHAAQCQRLARRAGLGLARTGSVATHGSGEIFVAFSTMYRSERGATGLIERQHVADASLDSLFEAVVDATEEAVLDSLFQATTVIGRHGRVAQALPLDELLPLLGR